MIQFINSENQEFKVISSLDEDIIAIGGKITEKRIIEAYHKGIFPWYNEEEKTPIWWSPRKRCVLFPTEFKISKSFKHFIKKHPYKITVNKSFNEVITNCRTIKRKEEEGTWINNDIVNIYTNLNKKGYTHSIEIWNNKGKLVGGLYGGFLNEIFFGESMFSFESNTSKLALYCLCRFMRLKKYKFIDCQVSNSHLTSLGTKEIKREDFLNLLHYK